MTATELIEKLSVFLVYLYLGRILSKEDFGYLNYIMAIVSYLHILIDLGLPKLAARELAAHPSLAYPLYRTVLMIRLGLFLIAVAMWIVFVATTQTDHLAIGLLLIVYLFARVPDLFWFLQGQQRFDLLGRMKLIKSMIVILGVGFLWQAPYAQTYIVFVVLAALAPSVWYWTRLRMYGAVLDRARLSFLRTNPKRMMVLMRRALPLVASSFLILMYYNFDTVMIGLLSDMTEVARYNAAYKLAFAFIVMRNLTQTVLFPRIAKAKTHWNEGQKVWMLSLVIAMGIVGISWWIGSDILQWAYGTKYTDATEVFFILSLSAALLWLNLFFPTYFIAIKREMFYLKVHAIAVGVNIVGNVLWIPRWGVEGAAWATVFADAVSFGIFASAYLHQRYRGHAR
jgi:O-antigen/teichoic acid export membrane protein